MTATIEVLRERYGDRHKWLVLLTVMIGTMASILSSTIVNVAIPDLSQHFQLGQERAQWVSSGFMLAMTMSMLTTPWLLLRFGLRRTYTVAILALLTGGVLGGFSINYSMLLSMRVLEGLASGILQPIPAIVILRAFDLKEQGKALGIFGFGVVLAPAVGPSVGGVLVEQFGWQSIFFVVVPFCLVVLVLIRRYLSTNSPLMGEARRFDWRGLLLAGTCTVTVLNGLVHLHDDRSLAVVLLTVALLSFIGFIAWQSHTDAPLMNLQLFGYRQFAMGGLVAFIYGMGLFGSTYLLPVYLQMALAYSPSRAGLVLLPAGIVLAITIPLAGKMADKYPPNVLVSIGLVLLALSFGLMALGQPGGSYLLLMAWAVIGRVGLGFVLPALSLGAMRGVDHGLIAQGASTLNFLRQLGGAIGVSLVGIVLEWRLAVHRSGSGIAANVEANRIQAFDETFLFVAALCAIAVAAAWRMRPATGTSL
ncbi:DHA2 family efflux MFS transporter permease subunit [Actimicrobium sp. CCC2.4]|uniref:DHA2 family efflux MFS transporter permease subunit n=1 Tax=Actimicrobium sp. CCC2.4 TaxID=3048606 RepID=UPI002AC97514|nr:DHA2 family efflux MFS transporter permease subunit [Actimicrobium sp. CCC2.4]MEB0135400.1 DHA2 family efflux MFS transporter permease subunit [Actimicrobium sp. CCC2.4]WPX32426.1 DHA2 family efflux MFS transporter permease subunit [Actimicrobium sp. CCC2.4]